MRFIDEPAVTSEFQVAPLTDYPLLNLAEWRAVVDRSFVPLEIGEYGGVPFAARLRTASLEDVSLFEIVSTPHVVRRTPELIRRVEGRYFKLSLQLEGDAMLEQGDRSAHITPGDLAIYDTHRPYRLTFPHETRFMVMMFPHDLVDLPEADLARLTAVCFPQEDWLSRIVSRLFVELAENLQDLSGAHAARVVRSSLDVLVTLLSARLQGGDPSPLPRDHVVRRARAFIQDNLADPGLSPTTVAKALYVSTRHLHGQFADQELTVSALIRTRRLERIRRDLGDPIRAGDRVSSIASSWGMTDAAHFSKAFKAQYGESPSDYRARVLAAGG